jgi:YD repeat-containing protein
VSETLAQGTVGYTYDAAGRRLTMTVPGQAQLTYTWDNANRLTGISPWISL